MAGVPLPVDWHHGTSIAGFASRVVEMIAARGGAANAVGDAALEELVARFVGKEAALVYNMGKCRGCRCVCTCVCPPTYLPTCMRSHVFLVCWIGRMILF
jgi:hypothetical protein